MIHVWATFLELRTSANDGSLELSSLDHTRALPLNHFELTNPPPSSHDPSLEPTDLEPPRLSEVTLHLEPEPLVDSSSTLTLPEAFLGTHLLGSNSLEALSLSLEESDKEKKIRISERLKTIQRVETEIETKEERVGPTQLLLGLLLLGPILLEASLAPQPRGSLGTLPVKAARWRNQVTNP